MKKSALILMLSLSLCSLTTTYAGPKKPVKQVKVTYITDMDCEDCEKKIRENISFEKGVSKLETKLETGAVTIVFNPEKTDTVKLAKAIRKLGYSAKAVESSDEK